MRAAVADTSPLRYLVLINAIDILPRLFDDVFVPDPVYAELRHARTPAAVSRWARSPPAWLTIAPTPAVRDPDLVRLDAGERAAIALAGDDHTAKSSTIPHQSDFSFLNVGIPFFYPGNTREILDHGLLAVALSRWSGAWVGMKLVTDVCDGGGTVALDPDLPSIRLPDGYEKYTDPRTVSPISRARNTVAP